MLRLLTCVAAAGVVVAGGGLAAAVTLQARAAPSASAPNPIPARMLRPDVPVPVSPSLVRVRNAWLVSDGRTLVAVYAGAAGNDSSIGRVVIVRQDLVAGRQTVSTVDAGATGALAIAAAPLGSAVETSAQTGIVRLRAAGGRQLRLDLGSGTVAGG